MQLVVHRACMTNFQQGNVVLCPLCALETAEKAHNVSVQNRTQFIDVTHSVVTCMKETLAKKKEIQSFQTVCIKGAKMYETQIASTHAHKPPQRFTSRASAHVPASLSEYRD